MTASLFRAIERYCLAKGARPGEGVNNFVPHDAVHAFAMARYLTSRERFDRYVAVAPEGFTYSFFFERLGCEILSLHVDYPPTRCDGSDDLSTIRGSRTLIIEDDVIGGATLRLVVAKLLEHEPSSLELYLGHASFVQHLENVPREIARTFIAERVLDPRDYGRHEREMTELLATP